AGRSGAHFVNQPVGNRPAMRGNKREGVAVNGASGAGMPDDNAGAGIDVNLPVDAIREREIMLVVVNKLDVMLARQVEIESCSRKPANVFAWVLELIIETIIIVC